MKASDEICLSTMEGLASECVYKTLLCETTGHALLARRLNMTKGPMSRRKRGEKCACGASLKLLSPVATNGVGAAG